ncbi:MAG: class I SAM-dependent methyltransferase [Desulfomonilaceae bacterium]
MRPSPSERTNEPPPGKVARADHGALMDRIYRRQRYIYDLTRRYFLLGRDTLIERMEVKAGDRVLEIGCGTARNLIHLARRYPSVQLFGIDASGEMLKSARTNLTRAGIRNQVQLAYCLAEEFSPVTLFGSTEPFDTVFFSYSLSMIPEWQAALDKGLFNVRTGRSLWVVDFWDQGGLSNWFAGVLQRWLSVFHVRHRPELLGYFRELERRGLITLSIEPLHRRYAYLARLTKIA